MRILSFVISFFSFAVFSSVGEVQDVRPVANKGIAKLVFNACLINFLRVFLDCIGVGFMMISNPVSELFGDVFLNIQYSVKNTQYSLKHSKNEY